MSSDEFTAKGLDMMTAAGFPVAWPGGLKANIEQRCPAPAPLVVNGGAYVGCELPTGHEGNHRVIVQWVS